MEEDSDVYGVQSVFWDRDDSEDESGASAAVETSSSGLIFCFYSETEESDGEDGPLLQ
jgi:hypothetical protein